MTDGVKLYICVFSYYRVYTASDAINPGSETFLFQIIHKADVEFPYVKSLNVFTV